MRLFVALDLPDEAVAVLERVAGAAAKGGLRPLEAGTFHVTLAFLGDRPEEEAEAIGAAVVGCAAPVPDLRLGAPAWLGRGSALSVELVDGVGAATALQAAVADALVALGVYAPEERPFRPHVTVARVRRGKRADKTLPAVPAAPPFAGTALTLYESWPSPAGARYAPLARADLPRA